MNDTTQKRNTPRHTAGVPVPSLTNQD